MAPFLDLFGTGDSASPSKRQQVLDHNNMEIPIYSEKGRKRAGKAAGGYQETA